MSEMYKLAAQTRLRFPSSRGELTVENLFQLPLKSATGGCDLDTIAKDVNGRLKAAGEESFVEDPTVDPQKQLLKVSLDILKDVIATKQAENRAVRTKLEKAAERKKILDALAAKKDAALTAASVDELEKKLAALEE